MCSIKNIWNLNTIIHHFGRICKICHKLYKNHSLNNLIKVQALSQIQLLIQQQLLCKNKIVSNRK